MRAPASFLHRRAARETSSSPAPRREMAPTIAVDSDAVVILASLLCMVVCVLGLGLLSRCVCRRCRRASSSPDPASPPPPKCLGTEAIDVLPTISFAAAAAAKSSSSECAICLAEFAQGEGVRVLPPCGHGFHLACIDAWLRKRATCPSCRGTISAAPVPTAQAVVAAAHAGGGDATFIAGYL